MTETSIRIQALEPEKRCRFTPKAEACVLGRSVPSGKFGLGSGTTLRPRAEHVVPIEASHERREQDLKAARPRGRQGAPVIRLSAGHSAVQARFKANTRGVSRGVPERQRTAVHGHRNALVWRVLRLARAQHARVLARVQRHSGNFVKTFKRDCVYVGDVDSARTVLTALPAYLPGYNENHLHQGLKMPSPRQFRRAHST